VVGNLGIFFGKKRSDMVSFLRFYLPPCDRFKPVDGRVCQSIDEVIIEAPLYTALKKYEHFLKQLR